MEKTTWFLDFLSFQSDLHIIAVHLLFHWFFEWSKWIHSSEYPLWEFDWWNFM